MAEIKRTFNIWGPYPINGLSRAAYQVADDFGLDCQIDREVVKTGWFSKRYEYHIRFSGEAVAVKNALDSMVIKTKAYADRVNAD
jgi:hypothetical protein